MTGMVVGTVFGVLLVWLALGAARRGELTLPLGNDAKKLRRGQRAFWPAVVVLLVAGVAALAAGLGAARTEVDPHGGARVTVEGPGFVLEVPERWRPAPEIAAAATPGGRDALAYAFPRGELVVMSLPAAELRSEPQAALAELVATLRDPAIGYERWEVTPAQDRVEVRMRYPSPRGEVSARVIGVVEDGALRSVHALCSSESEADARVCAEVVASLELAPRKESDAAAP